MASHHAAPALDAGAVGSQSNTAGVSDLQMAVAPVGVLYDILTPWDLCRGWPTRECQQLIFAANKTSSIAKPFEWITSEAVINQESLQFDDTGSHDHTTLIYKYLVGKGVLAPLPSASGAADTSGVDSPHVKYFFAPQQIDLADLTRSHGPDYLREFAGAKV